MFRILPILIVALCAAIYHASSKSLGKVELKPWATLTITYFIAFLISILGALFSRETAETSLSGVRAATPAMIALGIACVGIEGGYLFAYRLGWKVTELFSFTSFAATAAVLSVGFLFFREPISTRAAVGVLFALTGLTLMNWRVG